MEPIAVNHITVTRALFAQSHGAVFSKRRQRMLLYCGFVFLAFGLLFLALRPRFPAAAALSAPALLSGALVVVWALTLERSELRRKYRAFCRLNGEDARRTVTCYPGYLTVDTGRGEPVHIDYTDIQEHRETQDLLLLICRDHTGVQLAKDGFEAGSPAALLQAIEKAQAEAEQMRRLTEG